MKINRDYENVDMKIWRALKCKEIAALRYFLYKVWLVQFGFWKFIFVDDYNLKIIFGSVGTFSCPNYYACNGKPLFHLVETNFFYLSVHSW